MEHEVRKLERSGDAYFTVAWSALLPLDRPTVSGTIPSLAGLFEVYRDEGGRTPQLIGRSRAFYGGLRNTLRGLIDEDSPYPLNGSLLDPTARHYLRYTICGSSADMDDILFFYAGRDPYQDPDTEHSGRYTFVYVKEEPEGPGQ